jgi:hypothetical protein
LITISKAFSGPTGMGNGGYVCGALADHISGPAEVTLNVPCPLDTPLSVVDHADHVSLMQGDVEVATGQLSFPDIRAREAISFDQAVAASGDFSGFHYHPYPGCFVCGTNLAEGDGLRIYAGPVQGHKHVVAAPWIPHQNHIGADGVIDDKMIWSALDCPGAFTVMAEEEAPMLLGRLGVQIFGRPSVGEPCVVQGWMEEKEGRKVMVGTGLYGEDGNLLAVGKATWIIARQD